VNGSAHHFLETNDSNPKNKHGSHQNCHYEKHSEKFLHCVEIHFKSVRDQPSYDSFSTLAALSKVPVGR